MASEAGRAVIGLSHGDDDPGRADVDFGVMLSGRTLVVVERGQARRRAPLAAGDRIRVAVEAGRVVYMRNGRRIYRSRVAPDFPLLVDTSIRDRTSLGGVVIAGVLQRLAAEPPSFDPRGSTSSGPVSVVLTSGTDGARIHHDQFEGDPGPGRPFVSSGGTVSVDRTTGLRARAYADGLLPSATRRHVYAIDSGPSSEPVTWTRLDGVEAPAGILAKTRATRAWDSGAVSSRGILSDDGHFEFTLAERGSLVAGLSRGDRDAADDDVDFGFRVSGAALHVLEAGEVRAAVGRVRAGDRLRVSLEGGVVRYFRNGRALYESIRVPEYPLLVDTSIHHRAKVGDAVISGVLVDLALPEPRFDPPAGRYHAVQEVVLASEPETLVHYTSDGTDPDERSPMVPSGGSVRIDQSATLRARAYRDGWLPSPVAEAPFELAATTPLAAPPPGSYRPPLVVTLATPTPDAAIRYSLDGSEPTELSALYAGPITLAATTTLRARAYRPGWTPSETLSAFYEVLADEAQAPRFDPPGGTYLGARDVRISTETPGASIRYTTDGSEPTAGSPELPSGGVLHIAASTVLKAVASKPGHLTSPVATASYVILDDIGPELEPPGGTFTRAVPVRVLCPAPEIVVHYRKDGAVPTRADPAVACGEAIIVERSLTLTALAFLGEDAGEPVSASYTIADGVSAGPTHLLLLRRDGAVWGWGENASGQLGDGTLDPSSDPKPSLASGMVQVAAGGRHSLAVSEDGSVWAWGDGSSGQLGHDVAAGSPAPVRVSGLAGVTAVAAGESHSLALRADGTLWAWGDNSHGQLGTGSTDVALAPVQVATLSDVVEIAAGRRHSLARLSDGSTWAWGAGDRGQLGLGTTDPGLTPSLVPGLPPAARVAAGDEHSLAVADDGSLWGWGSLDPAQLEPDTHGPVLSPVLLGTTSCGEGEAFGPLGDARLAEGGEGRSVVATGEGLLRWESDADSYCTASWLQSLVEGEVVRLSAAGRRYLAVTSDGTVWYWEDLDANPAAAYPVTGPTGELRVLPPAISVRGGVYSVELDVTLVARTPGSTIHYTTDGSEPDESSPTIASGASVHIDRSTTLHAIAVRPDRPPSAASRADYVLKVIQPTLDPPPSAFHAPLEVAVSVATPGAMLRVRRGGGLPQPGDPELPSGALVQVTPPDELQVEAFRDGWESTIAGGTYRLGVATPVISPHGGVFDSPVTVTITTATPGAILFYSLDHRAPAFGHPIVSGGTLRIDRSATLRVVGYLGDFQGASDEAVANFRFALPAPTLHVDRPLGPEGPFYVTGASDVPGAIVRCTVDGSEPHARSPICTLPVPVDASATVRARAFLAGWDGSPISEKAVLVSGAPVRNPAISLPGGRYPSRRTVRIDAPTPGATIRYTTNGSDPTESDAVLVPGGELVVDRSLTLKARAFLAGAASLVARADYILTGAVGGDFTLLALAADGTVWGFGHNGSGLVGNGQASPVPVTSPERATIDAVVSLAVGESHAVALREDGSVWTWGADVNGQRGLVPSTPGPEPTSLSGVTAVAAGTGFGAALAEGGSLWVWGGSSAPEAHVPREVPGVRCVEIHAKDERIACIEASGRTLVGFVQGDFQPAPDLYGFLGFADDGSALVGAGDRRGLFLDRFSNGVKRFDLPPAYLGARNALVADRGTAWAATESSFAGLGAVTVVAEASPAVLVGSSSVADAAGVIWRWGDNSAGQLGDGTTTDRLEPAEVSGFRLFDDAWFRDDTDQDGLDNLAEHYLGSDWLRADTNGDGVADGASVAIGRDPVSVDLDADGLSNADEGAIGTGLLTPDSDGDGVRDGLDRYPLDPSRSEPRAPDAGDTTAPVILLREPASAVLISSTP